MLRTKVRATIISFLAALSVAASLAPAAAQARPLRLGVTEGDVCLMEGAQITDRWGNVYICSGGTWVLWSMPAYTFRF